MEKSPFEKPAAREQPQKHELTPERRKALRELVEVSNELNLSPRAVIHRAIREHGVSVENFNLLTDGFKSRFAKRPKWVRFLYPSPEVQIDVAMIEDPSIWDDFDYETTLGEALRDANIVQKLPGEHPGDTYLRAIRNPEFITDREKYKEVIKEADQKFLENFSPYIDDEALKNIKEDLKKAFVLKKKEELKVAKAA